MKRLLVGSILVGSMIFAVGCSSTEEQDTTETAAAPVKKEEPKKLGIGDTADISGIKTTVTGIREVEPSTGVTVKEGEKIYAVDLMMENVGTEEKIFSSMLGAKAVNTEGYDCHLALITGDHAMDGHLVPGVQKQGSVFFKSTSALQVVTFNIGLEDDKETFFLNN